MPNLGPAELLIVVVYPVLFLVPAAILYFIIRQAVLSALRKFYRELGEAGGETKPKAGI